MPSDTSKYISDEYITLDQIFREFNSVLSGWLYQRQAPLIRELRDKGATYQHIADLLGVSKQAVQKMVTKNETK